ncbi:MAG: hypothetical protein MPJ24_06200 [Pirellulaceae bacterium]|nr:hypothetical protein [Pirellulaceae bacterium]
MNREKQYQETDMLAMLIEQKYQHLVELEKLTSKQPRVIEQAEMTTLLQILTAKQTLLDTIQRIEKQLDPFRTQDPELRVWRSEAHRQNCQTLNEKSEKILSGILSQERECEEDLIQRREATSERLHTAHRARTAQNTYANNERAAVGTTTQLDLNS